MSGPYIREPPVPDDRGTCRLCLPVTFYLYFGVCIAGTMELGDLTGYWALEMQTHLQGTVTTSGPLFPRANGASETKLPC
jgi:hypothetical protein